MFPSKLKKMIVILALSASLAVPSAWAEDLLAPNDAGSMLVIGEGQLETQQDGSAVWKGPGGDSDWERSFLEYDVSSSGLGSVQGTLFVELVRDESFHREAVFSLAAEDLERLFVCRIYWDGSEGMPELQFYGGAETDFWFVRDPEYFNYPRPRISFPDLVRKGEKVYLVLTWGSKEQRQVYVNGQSLGTETSGSFLFPQLVSLASKLILGAETSAKRNPDGAWSMTSSPITSFRVFDTALSEEEVRSLSGAAITSVEHDAFSRAGYSGKLVAGESFTVTMKADPGGTASFDVVQPASTIDGETVPEEVRIAGVPLAEDPENPGTYTGTYAVQYGDEAAEALVVGRFANPFGIEARPRASSRPVSIDGRVHLAVQANSDLVPANRSSRSGLTITATDANGRKIRDHRLALTLSTTDEYTGIVGGSSFEDAVGGSLDVDWGGVTDSFGEVTAQLVSGFAAKTMVVSAKDMVSGDVGVGWVRSYIEGAVEIVVKPARTSALSFAGSMELSASREWLTADGKSRSRITAVVKDAAGAPMEGHVISFSLVGTNGSVRVIQSKTDSRGRAFADYIAGKKMGQVTIEVRDTTGGLFGSINIELRADAPAKIALTADPAEIYIGGDGTTVTAEVMDINDNPNHNVDVVYDISAGEGSLSAPSVATDRNGKASVTFNPGDTPGTVTVRGTVTSRAPTAEEISAAEGAVFLYGLSEDPGVLEVTGWLVESGDEVVEGQDLVTLEDRRGTIYTVKSPRDGEVSVFVAEEGDEVQYGDTLGYILLVEEK